MCYSYSKCVFKVLREHMDGKISFQALSLSFTSQDSTDPCVLISDAFTLSCSCMLYAFSLSGFMKMGDGRCMHSHIRVHVCTCIQPMRLHEDGRYRY